MACAHCGAYDGDDEYGDDTETEDDADQSSQEYHAFLGDLSGATYEGLRQDYLLAKARFRHLSGRFSRRSRFPRRAPWAKGRGKKGRGGKGRKGKFPIAHGYPSKGMPAHVLAGGNGESGKPPPSLWRRHEMPRLWQRHPLDRPMPAQKGQGRQEGS